MQKYPFKIGLGINIFLPNPYIPKSKQETNVVNSELKDDWLATGYNVTAHIPEATSHEALISASPAPKVKSRPYN